MCLSRAYVSNNVREDKKSTSVQITVEKSNKYISYMWIQTISKPKKRRMRDYRFCYGH